MGLLGQVTVSRDAVKPRTFKKLPRGRYVGTVKAAEVKANDNGWEAVGVTVGIVRGTTGQTTFSADDQDYGIAREIRQQFTITTVLNQEDGSPRTDEKADTARRISAENFAALAHALGIASYNDEGNIDPPDFESTQDYVDWLSAGFGNEIGVSIGHEQVNSKESNYKQPARDDDGSIVMREKVSGFFSLEDL